MQIRKQGLSQEGLKLIACVSMLVDHIGMLFLPGLGFRMIGRIAFPIYCFLLVEGEHYTRNPKRYALRLAIGALLSELPYDLACYGGWSWAHQSVMVTLLLGFFALRVIRWEGNALVKLAGVGACAAAAHFLRVSYGCNGVLLIALLALTREAKHRWLAQLLCMLVVFGRMSSVTLFSIAGFGFTLQMLGAASVIPIALYSGRKATAGKAVQWGFYLFYPAHQAVLYLLKVLF